MVRGLFATLVAVFFTVSMSSQVFGKVQNPPDPVSTFVESKIRKMSLEDKIGQLLFVGFRGLNASEEAAKLIKEFHVGGMILFSHNIRDASQVAALNRQLRFLSTKAGTPAFLATDQEGGKVSRLRRIKTLFPNAMSLGATQSRELAYHMGYTVARELDSLGFNMNLAPVIDVERAQSKSAIGVRSLSENPVVVGDLAKEELRGHADGHVIPVVKHFPGHGTVAEDSHFTTPSSQLSYDDLVAYDLVPYRSLISSNQLSAIMTAHVRFPKIDTSNLPATLSPFFIQSLLRNQMGFKGVVLTDDLEMRGVSNIVGTGEAAVQAIRAGADLLMVLWSYPTKKKVFQHLIHSVRTGVISELRLNESVRRILTLKARNGIFDEMRMPVRIPASESIESQKLSESILRRSLTLIKNEDTLIPLKQSRLARVTVASPVSKLGETIKQISKGQTILVRTAPNPSNEETALALKQILQGDPTTIIVGMSSLSHNRLIEKLRASTHRPRPKLVAVSFDTPYLLSDFTRVDGYLVTYTASQQAGEMAAKVLLGIEPALGQWPNFVKEEESHGL